MVHPLQQIDQVRGKLARLFIQRDHVPAMGNAQLLYQGQQAVQQFRHSSTLSRRIEV